VPVETTADLQKRAVARAAAQRVQPGMRLGLGSGSTMRHVTEAIAARVRAGELPGLEVVPTSLEVAALAGRFGWKLSSPDGPALDLDIDGADEVDPELNLSKGLGAALFREKVVAEAAETFLVVVDQSKWVDRLGQRAPVSVEVVPFGYQAALRRLAGYGRPQLRLQGGRPLRSDNGNLLVDLAIVPGEFPLADLYRELKLITGVVETGLFLGLASEVLTASAEGIHSRQRP
jgi:ribose 5-phosphate isomerase A